MPPSKGRVLIVEDDKSSLGALASILRYWGWQVDTAMTVAEAMAKLHSGFSHVVLDLMLPDGDGIAVLHHIRREQWSTAVIITTGLSDTARLNSVRDLSPAGLLVKPIDLNQLEKYLG